MHPDKAGAAVEALAERLGVDAIEAAGGILEIINVNMMGAVRVISVEQGEDPRDFTLVAFGGAGPLHAADVARNMGMRKVLVPPRPGLLSAIGLLHADVRGDFSLTRLLRAERGNLKALNNGFEALKQRGTAWLKGEGESRARFEWSADLRYFGQNFELIVDAGSGRLNEATLTRLVSTFHHRHKDYYGYDMPQQPVEIVNLRLVVTAKRRTPAHEKAPAKRGTVQQSLVEKRKVWYPGSGFVTTPVYDREWLPPRCRLVGPAIIEQMDATTVVPPRARVKNDALGYLHLELEAPVAQKRNAAWTVA